MIAEHRIAGATFALALLVTSSPALALSCVTELDDFDFMTGSPTTFSVGSREEVDRIYERLAAEIGDLSTYEHTTIFVSRDYDEVVQEECRSVQCSGSDMQAGLERCVAGGGETCHPLAVVYRQKLYCLLSPGQENFDPTVPFLPYTPFER